MAFPARFKVTEYQVVDHGIDGSQYFQGCGVTFTQFQHVATGCGNDFAEAIEDALESIAEENVDVDDLEQRIRVELESPVKRGSVAAECWPKSDSASELYPDEDSEMYYYVSIRWNQEESK